MSYKAADFNPLTKILMPRAEILFDKLRKSIDEENDVSVAVKLLACSKLHEHYLTLWSDINDDEDNS